MMNNIKKALAFSSAVNAYLRAQHGPGDLSWHPLFIASKDLFLLLMKGY